MLELAQYITYVPVLVLATARVGGMFMFAPVFGSEVVPVRLRLFMSVAVSLAVVSRISQPVLLPAGVVELAFALACEFAIGAVVGYAAALIFVGVELAAMHIGQQAGIGLAGVFAPFGAESADATRRLVRIFAVVIFLTIGGHRMLIGSLLESFQAIPLMGLLLPAGVLNMAVGLLGVSFALALKIAAPVLIALLLATVALGMIQRTVPQCNMFSVGLPIRAMLVLVVLAAALAAMGGVIEAAWQTTSEVVRHLFQAGG